MKGKTIKGGGYITSVYTLLSFGADVIEKVSNIAGFKCRQYIIGDKYKLLSRVDWEEKTSLFEKYGSCWTRLPASYKVAQFIFNMVRYRKYIFVKNKDYGEQ